MSQMDDQKETKSLIGDIDIADLISFFIFGAYTYLSIRLSMEAYRSANKEYVKNRS